MTQSEQLLAVSIFPFLKDVDGAFSVIHQYFHKRDTVLLFDGSETESVLLVLQGSVRVYKVSELGRELTLYRVEPGETCVLLLSSVLAERAYPAVAVTDADTLAIHIPARRFKQWMQNNREVQEFVFQILNKRLVHVMMLVEEIVFRSMDLRCAEYLLKRSSPEQPQVFVTHDEIAGDLGSAREVVSRVLKEFEKDGLLALSRGKIEVLDRRRLMRMAEGLLA